jgi:hypothetical protein
MEQAGSVKFVDADSGDDAYASVRYDGATVALAISLKSDGDVEVFMSKQDARLLLDALRVAVS